MEKRGLLVARRHLAESGREARFYRISALGRSEMDMCLATWICQVAAMAQVLGGGGEA